MASLFQADSTIVALSTNKTHYTFKEFSDTVCKLFGWNIFYMTNFEIDSVLRKVYRELV